MGPAAGLPGAATSAGAAPGLAAPPSAFTRRGQPARRAQVRLTLTGTRGDSPLEAGPTAVVSRGPRWRLGGGPTKWSPKAQAGGAAFPAPLLPLVTSRRGRVVLRQKGGFSSPCVWKDCLFFNLFFF